MFLLIGGLGNADFLTRASFAFIDVAIFPYASFRTGVILNCWGLVYLRAVQLWFFLTDRALGWEELPVVGV